jgi:hypothetical protein
VTFRSRLLLAGMLAGCLGSPAFAAPPAPLILDPPPAATGRNQQTANAIAATLRQSGLLRHFTIDISFRDGTAELIGAVADQAQREETRRIVQGVPGVERVLDRLTLAGAIQPVRAADVKPADPLARPRAGGNGVVEEPQPEFAAPAPQPSDLNPPRMPPYAWPTYAPYNNYSRCAYPTAYPYNAWPFIGPIYPFPKVPLGWRAVKLEWDDGYWWFSRTATKYNWWKLRYY